MGLKVLVILGHPRKDSLCAALADAYVDGAHEVAVQTDLEIRRLIVADLAFEPNVTHTSPNNQCVEADILQAREWMAWADHLVFVYPNWWGTMPALMKGFLDRLMTPGFAFAEDEGGGWVPLLKGKTAQLISTMDMPRWVYRLFIGQPGNNAMRKAVLGFCGMRTVRIRNFGPVKDSNDAIREAWLATAKADGRRLISGVRSRRQRLTDKVVAWLKAIRLQFYPLTWVAYTAGALAASFGSGALDVSLFWLGYGALFFLEVATVFCNEYFDYPTDKLNAKFGPFNGGSRVLVEKLLSFREIKWGIATALMLAVVLAGGLIMVVSQAVVWPATVSLVILFVLALGYTVPPLKLVYHGLGELDVVITHSFGVLLCGYIFQGGQWSDALPWMISLPLCLSILPSIVLSNIPDVESDQTVSKRTVAVLLGPRMAVRISLVFTLLAAFTVLYLQWADHVGQTFTGMLYFIAPHGLYLSWMLWTYLRRYERPGRINHLMMASLGYSVWFSVIPLLNLS